MTNQIIAKPLSDWTIIALVVLAVICAVICVAVLVLAVEWYDSGEIQIQFGSQPQEGIMPTGRGKPGIMPPLWPDGQPERRLPALERAQADLLERRRLDGAMNVVSFNGRRR